MIYNKEFFLKLANEANIVVSIFTDIYNKEKCSTGFIKSIDKTDILLKHLNQNGESDGYILRRIEDIYRIDIDGLYENKLKKLYYYKNEEHDKLLLENKNIRYELLLFAEQHRKFLEISIDYDNEQEIIVGYIKRIDTENDNFFINKVNSYGVDDGITVIHIDDIISLNYDSNDARDLSILYNCDRK